MIKFILPFFFFGLVAHAQSASAPDWSARTEAQEVVLQRGSVKWTFSTYVEFKSARDNLLLLTTKNSNYDSIWDNEQSISLPTATFKRLLKIWGEASLKPKIETRLGSWVDQGDTTTLLIKKSLRQKIYDAGTTPNADLLWLGCYDGPEKCLGITDSVSNPNLLSNEVTPQDFGIISIAEIKDFLSRTANLKQADLESAFRRAHFPESLVKWYSLKLLSRRASMAGVSTEANTFLKALANFQSEGLFVDGQLRSAPENFEVDFTFDHLEARIHDFLLNRYANVATFADYLLAHFPYTSYDFGKGADGLSVGPGFMFRVKRHITQNPNPNSPTDLYKVEDSLELFVSFSFGVARKFGPVSASIGAGPAYMKKYLFNSFSSSKQQAQKSRWTLTKEMLLGTSLSKLRPRESLTLESGFMANASLSGNVAILGQSYVRPQGYVMANYQWLGRAYVFVESENTALVGFGKSRGLELTSQAVVRAITKIARVPFFSWSKKWSTQNGGVYRIPLQVLNDESNTSFVDAITDRDEAVFKKSFPMAQYRTNYRQDYFFLNLGFFSIRNSAWNGFVDLAPDAGPTPLLPDARKFYLLESSAEDKNTYSLTRAPNNRSCAAWAAFEASPQDPKRFTDGTLKLSCTDEFVANRVPSIGQLHETLDMLKIDRAEAQTILKNIAAQEKLQLSWQVQFSWKQLESIISTDHQFWLNILKAEVTRARQDSNQIDLEAAQERMYLFSSLGNIFSQTSPDKRAYKFFNLISSTSAKDLFLKALLGRLPSVYVRLESFRPLSATDATIENVYSHGAIDNSTTFQIIQEKNKWLGLN